MQVENRIGADFGHEWQELCKVLGGDLVRDFAPEDLSLYLDLTLRAARFSFSVSELPE